MTSRTRPDSSDSSNKRTIQPDGSIRVTVQGANHAECTAAGGFQDDSTCLDLESTLEDVADQAAMFTSSITSRERFDGVVVTDAATAMQAMYSTHTPCGHGDTDYVNSSGGHFSIMHSDIGSPYSTDAPAFPDMQYHGRPASGLTNASVSGPSAAMSTADQQGKIHTLQLCFYQQQSWLPRSQDTTLGLQRICGICTLLIHNSANQLRTIASVSTNTCKMQNTCMQNTCMQNTAQSSFLSGHVQMYLCQRKSG